MTDLYFEAKSLIEEVIIPMFQDNSDPAPTLNELTSLLAIDGIDTDNALRTIKLLSREPYFFEKLGYHDTKEDINVGAEMIRDYVRDLYNSGATNLPEAEHLKIFAHEKLGLSPLSTDKAFEIAKKEHRSYFKAMGYEMRWFIPPGIDNLHHARSIHDYV